MRKYLLRSFFIMPLLMLLFIDVNSRSGQTVTVSEPKQSNHAADITEKEVGPYFAMGIVKPRETLAGIFKRHNLNKDEMSEIYLSSKEFYNLSKIKIGHIYSFEINREDNSILKMQYGIDDDTYLVVEKDEDRFVVKKKEIEPDIRIGSFHVDVKGSLSSSMPGPHKEYHKIALELSDIYAWDIDFSNDIRDGDSMKIIVEEQWVGDVFKGYGEILAAEFVNNGTVHRAYRFEHDGYADYYDNNGRSLKKALLRTPLKFKYISSGFSKRRFHPILKRYRPHLGIDYAAPKGTPVSAAGSGKILYAGYKGQNGRMVRIKHQGGYETYYGHLSRIPKKIKRGARVSQGDIIGYVGSTGLSTGPHLDYRMKHKGRFVNPLKVNLPRGKSVQKGMMARFKTVVDGLSYRLDTIGTPVVAFQSRVKRAG